MHSKAKMKTNMFIYTGTGRRNLIVNFTHKTPHSTFSHSLINEVPIFKTGKFNIEK